MNMMTATECLLRMCEEHHELEDYQSGVPRWCTGCGDNAILAAVQRLCRDESLRPEKTVFVSGIGCSSRFPHYMKTYGFHGIHGRALPIAEGVKMARPDLNVFVNTGDGDCCSIGAAHWIHAIRYNMNLTVLLHDNQIYGLTKKQASPTSPIGTKSNTTPRGCVPGGAESAHRDARRAERSFVAQAVDWIPEMLYDIVKAAFHHKGLSFVRIVQRCPEWLPKLHDPWLHDPQRRSRCCTTSDGLQLSAGLGRSTEPARARSARHPPRARDRQRHRPDPGRHPVPQSRGALLRGPAARGPAAHAATDPAGLKPNSTSSPSGRRHAKQRRRRMRQPGSTRWTATQAEPRRSRFLPHRQAPRRGLDAVDGLDLRPALLARYRDLDALRYDFPLVLVEQRGDAGARALAVAARRQRARRRRQGRRRRPHEPPRAAAGAGNPRRCCSRRRHRARCRRSGTTPRRGWRREARRITERQPAARARAALEVDGELLRLRRGDCPRACSARLERAQERKARRLRERPRAADQQLSDILRADVARSAAGRSATRLKASVGTGHGDAFDFDALSRVLAKALPRRRAARQPARAHRRAARRARVAALLRRARRERARVARRAAYDFAFDSCAAALRRYRERLPKAIELAKAIAIAELEVDGDYQRGQHDALFEDFGANGLEPRRRWRVSPTTWSASPPASA